MYSQVIENYQKIIENPNVSEEQKASISVIIGKQDLSQEEIAQIQNIISRELEASADNIHISVK